MTLPYGKRPKKESYVNNEKQPVAQATGIDMSSRCTSRAFMSKTRPYLTPAATLLGRGMASAGGGRPLTAQQSCPHSRHHLALPHPAILRAWPGGPLEVPNRDEHQSSLLSPSHLAGWSPAAACARCGTKVISSLYIAVSRNSRGAAPNSY